MNISTLAKILGVSVSDLRDTGTSKSIPGFAGRNTRIPYNSALEITKILRPDKAAKLQNDDKIYLPASMTVADFAETIGRPSGNVVKTLIMNGVMVTLNEKIDYDTANLIAEELGIQVYPDSLDIETRNVNSADLNNINAFELDGSETGKIVPRPPVVTVMGHVDHGKTTLLDTIRKTNVVAGEAGAITQHISSYQIDFKGNKITFIDTPGHAAFTAMRARGTQLADFIILMVSATEGPKPQTVEVIERAKLSKTPVIVAINKMDLPEADIDRVKQEIAAFGLVPEEWGGNTPFIPISAKIGTNLDMLLDTLMLHAEVANLKGQINVPGQAVVVESHLDSKQGEETTLLVTKGELKVGDHIRTGQTVAKIKKILNTEGKVISAGSLGMPVVIYGFPTGVSIGELVQCYETAKEAVNAASMETAKKVAKKGNILQTVAVTEGQINLVLKADVAGSLEALKETILKIPQENTTITIKSASVGSITESDVEFAKTSQSTILAFHTNLLPGIAKQIETSKVNLVQSDIIYELLNWLEEQILANTSHEIKITVLGKLKVLALFKSDKNNIQVFGGEVLDGKIFSNKQLRIAGAEGQNLEIIELQRNKEKVKEVNAPQQFGVSVSGKTKIKVGDELECFDETVILNK